LIKYVDIVKATAPISFGSAEDDHMNSKPAADLTRALRPGTVLEDPSIYIGPVDIAIEDQFVGPKDIQGLVDGGSAAVILS
jgi:hypothetical protein